MNQELTKRLKKILSQESGWELGNQVLYDMCKHNFSHKNSQEISAKIWLIERTYAASIERRRKNSSKNNDHFFVKKIVPIIKNSSIDFLFKKLIRNKSNLDLVLETHNYVTNLFFKITDLEKRSLASKYLHFHFPNIYFMYDSRANKTVNKLCKALGIKNSLVKKLFTKNVAKCDKIYAIFFIKCRLICDAIKNEFAYSLSPRQLDNIFLYHTAEVVSCLKLNKKRVD